MKHCATSFIRCVLPLVFLTALEHTVMAQSLRSGVSARTQVQGMNSTDGMNAWFIVRNAGQISDLDGNARPDIRAVLHAGTMRMYLRSTGFTFVQTISMENKKHEESDHSRSFSHEPRAMKLERIDVNFAHANPWPRIEESDALDWYANFFTAAKPDGALFLRPVRRVTYKNVWPNIDLDLRIDHRGVKYEFVVHPGGNPHDIALRYSDGVHPEIRSDGSVEVRGQIFRLEESRPVTFVKSPSGSSREVESGFVERNGCLGFAIAGQLQTGETLVIDPSISWSTYIGSNANDFAGAVDVDANGNVWVCGGTAGSNFPTTSGVFQPGKSGATNDGFIIKFSSSGARLWGTYYEGADVFTGINCDPYGNAVLTGATGYTNFPVSSGAFQTTKSSGFDAVLIKMLSDGNRSWATFLGGNGGDVGIGTYFESYSTFYVTGQTASTNFPVTAGAFQTANAGAADAFLFKFDTSGARVWGTYIGSSSNQFGHGCFVDGNSNVIVVGTTGTGFPTTSGTVQPNFPGGSTSAFVIKFDNTGARLWATYFGSSTIGYGINAIGNDMAIVGWTTGTIPVTTGAFQTTRPGAEDAYIARLNAAGTGVIWATYFGGSSMDHITSIRTNSTGRIHVTGCTYSSNFPVTQGAYQTNYGGNEDRFVAQFSPDGQRCWSTYIGGAGTDYCWVGAAIGERPEHSIAIGPQDDFYIVGITTGNFPTTSGAFRTTAVGGTDAFLARFVNDCNGMVVANAGNDVSVCRGGSVQIGANAYVNPCGIPVTYSWSPAAFLDSANIALPRASPTSTMEFFVTVTDANGCTSEDTVLVTVTGLGVTITPDTVTICPGGSAVLQATTGSGWNYTWLLNGSPISGANASSYTATQAGNYRVIVITPAGCYDTSSVAVVSIGSGPGASLTPPGPISFCPGGSAVLTANTGSGLTYSWLRNGTPISGASGSSYTATQAGSYRVIVTNSYGCPDTSNAVIITLYATPGASITPAGPTTFCAGGSVMLNANTGTSLTYQWMMNGSNIPNATSSSYLATQAGSFRVIVTNANGCSDTSAAVVVTVNARPGAYITPPGPISGCVGQQIPLSANTGIGLTYNWLLNGSPISGATSSTYVATQSGSFQVIVTNAAGCRDTSAAVVITLNPRPTAGISAAGPTVFCEPGSVELIASPSTGVTYEWLRNGSTISGAVSSTFLATQSGSYRVIVTNTFGCSDTSAAIVVTINPRPTASITGGPSPICEGEFATLTAATGAGYIYEWQRDGLSIPGATAPTYYARQAGSYRVIVTAPNGCKDTSGVFVLIVHPKPIVTIAALGPTVFCEPGSVTLEGTAPVGSSFSWLQNGSVIPGASTSTFIATQSGRYQVIATNANGCSDTSRAIDVLVHPLPDVTIAPPGPILLCEGKSVVLSVPSGTGYQYEWQRNETTIVGANGSTLLVNRAGSYRVIVMTANGCIDTSDQVVIDVKPIPNWRIEGKTSVCPNAIAAYFVTNSGGLSFDWTVSNGTIMSGQASGKIDVRWGTPGTGEVRVRITEVATGCTKDTMLSVLISSSLRPVIVSNGPPRLCEGDSLLLDAGAGYLSYEWFRNGTQTGDTTRTIMARLPGVYTVSVTDGSGCSGLSAPFDLFINQKPILSLQALGPTIICAGERVTLRAAAVPNVTYRWFRNGQEILGATSETFITSQPGIYRVSGTTSAGCEGTSDSVEVVVKAAPKAAIAALGPTTFCTNGSVTMKALPDSGVRYEWLRDGSPVPGAESSTLTVNQSGQYRVVVFDLVAGCKDSSQAITVIVHPLPTIQITGAAFFCNGESTTLSASGSAGIYLWSTSETTQNIVVNRPGDYDVTVTDANGCSAKAGITVVMRPRPSLSVQGSRTICTGGQTTLDAQSGFASYRWSTGATTQRVTLRTAGMYWIEVVDSNGCTARDTVTILESDRLSPTVSGRTVLCPNGTTTLEADSNETYTRYIWTTEADTTTYLANTRRFTVTSAGRYVVRVVDAGGCSGNMVVDVTSAQPIKPVVSGRFFVCTGLSSDTLTVIGDYFGYRWSSGQTSRSIVVTQPGRYTVDVTDSNGCIWPASVDVNERLVQPVITGTKVFCPTGSATLSVIWPSAMSYEWSSGERTRDVSLRTPGPIWVRVTDSSGCEGIAFDTLRISTSLVPSVTGALQFCAGRSTTLDAGAGYQWYRWSALDTTNLLSAGRTCTIMSPGEYIIRVGDASGCEGIDTLTVTHYPATNARIVGDTILCFGGSGQLGVTPSMIRYEWSTGDTTSNISVTASGAYWVRVVNAFGCDDTLRMDVQMQSIIPIAVAGRAGFCRGSSDTLDAGSGFVSYRWSSLDTTVILGTQRTLVVSQAGTYIVRVITPSGCRGSGSIDIVEYPLPQPSITQVGDSLESTAFISYQWMMNGIDLTGATSRRIKPTTSGRYVVRVTDSNGCIGLSPPFDFVAAVGSTQLSLLCNPQGVHPVGSIVSVPLLLESFLNVQPGGASEFTAFVTTVPTVAFPRFSATEVDRQGKRVTYRIRGVRDPSLTQGTLFEMPFEVLWGDTTCSRIRIDSVQWNDETSATLLGAECDICAELCNEGGVRLFYASGRVSLFNHPNPFNATTMIEFEIIEKGTTDVSIYDRLGRRIATVVHDDLEPGRYLMRFDASALASGTYFCVLQTPTEQRLKLMEVLK